MRALGPTELSSVIAAKVRGEVPFNASSAPVAHAADCPCCSRKEGSIYQSPEFQSAMKLLMPTIR